METKINIILLVIGLINFGCSNHNSNKFIIETVNYDTIYFASENNIHKYQSAYFVEGAIKEQNFVALKSIGKSSIVWIDSILYEKKGIKSFFSIIREPTRGYYVIYYNGDSIIEQVVSKKCPKIDINIKDREFTMITIRDSMYNSGFLDMVVFNYTLSDSCILLKEELNFPKIPINHE
jgi:hypothetical protein